MTPMIFPFLVVRTQLDSAQILQSRSQGAELPRTDGWAEEQPQMLIRYKPHRLSVKVWLDKPAWEPRIPTLFERDDHSPHHHSLTCFLSRCTTARVDFRIWTLSGHRQCHRNGMCCATVWTVPVTCFALVNAYIRVQTYISLLKNERLATNAKPKRLFNLPPRKIR